MALAAVRAEIPSACAYSVVPAPERRNASALISFKDNPGRSSMAVPMLRMTRPLPAPIVGAYAGRSPHGPSIP